MSSTKAIVEADFDLLVCATCGAQFSEGTPASHTCDICADDRQWVPLDGQIWTSLRKLTEAGQKIVFTPDREDKEMWWLVTTPGVAIFQSPLLVKTPSGWVMVECCAFVSVEAIETIKSMVAESGLPFLGIALSHPHWYNSGTVWARALGCKIFASALDKEWWMRKESIDEVVEWWSGPEKKLSAHVTMILCGGHFDGSCVTHIRREGSTPSLMCVADTIMISWSSVRRQVSFMYSYPQYIPLHPREIVAIWKAIEPYEFENAYGAWTTRRLVGGARKEIYDQLGPFFAHQGVKGEEYGLGAFTEVSK